MTSFSHNQDRDIAWEFLIDYKNIIGSVFITFLLVLVSRSVFGGGQAIPRIHVPLPEQARKGWTGKTLSHPSIHGDDPTVIQCYCPATGQLIDSVRAATTLAVDDAIDKAQKAQLKWRTTTFKERKLVLKTLLKFCLENQGTITFGALTNPVREHCQSVMS